MERDFGTKLKEPQTGYVVWQPSVKIWFCQKYLHVLNTFLPLQTYQLTARNTTIMLLITKITM